MQGREFGVSHDHGEEVLLAKARWFAQFTPEERLRMAMEWAETMLTLNPRIAEIDREYPTGRTVQVLELR